MRFLIKIGVANFEPHYIEDLLKPLEDRYFDYRTRLTEEGPVAMENEAGDDYDIES